MVLDTVNITNDIIQGSSLGAVFFMLCINSIVQVFRDNVTCLLIVYVKIYTVIRSDSSRI